MRGAAPPGAATIAPAPDRSPTPAEQPLQGLRRRRSSLGALAPSIGGSTGLWKITQHAAQILGYSLILVIFGTLLLVLMRAVPWTTGPSDTGSSGAAAARRANLGRTVAGV